jgi:hypothetical protein
MKPRDTEKKPYQYTCVFAFGTMREDMDEGFGEVSVVKKLEPLQLNLSA